MKACIIGIQNLKHMTLISLYTDYFEKNSIQYDLIYIDKYGINEKNNARKVYKFNGKCSKYSTLVGKLLKTYDYKKYVIRILDSEKYDFVVIWREQTASIFAGYLVNKYKGKYCVNIRDLWDRKNIFITNGLKRAVDYSAFNTISSEGFRKFLPKNSAYIMTHSANPQVVYNLKASNRKSRNEPINIVYLGTVRYFEYCKAVIDCFGNDERFIIKFIGQGSIELYEYIEKNKYKNIICEGAFDASETVKLLEGADVINCAFGAKNDQEKFLTPIRFYYSLFMHIPALTTDETWMDEQCKTLSMNLTIPKELTTNRVADIVYYEYHSIDWNLMCKKIDEYICTINQDNQELIQVLDHIVR